MDQDHELQQPAQELETAHKDDLANEENLDDIDHDLEYFKDLLGFFILIPKKFSIIISSDHETVQIFSLDHSNSNHAIDHNREFDHENEIVLENVFLYFLILNLFPFRPRYGN